MVRAHRQAWSWQDEYHGLTMDDIRELERETQLALQEQFAAEQAEEDDEAGGTDHSPKKEIISLPSQDGSIRVSRNGLKWKVLFC
jgi:hypothetical protein